MPNCRTALALLCIAVAAQAQVDLNTLESAASRYTSHGVTGIPNHASLDLQLLRGDGGTVPATLMVRAADVQHWSLFYNLAGVGAGPDQPRSVDLQCDKGLFSGISTGRSPIPDCRSLEDLWVAVTLDAAIAQLNGLGYVRGFSEVELRRPDLPGVPAEPVYVFNCPWERTYVAISGNTGAMTWYQVY